MRQIKKNNIQIEADENQRKALVLNNEMNKKWGISVLSSLATPKLKQRWQKQLLLLARATADLDYAAISKHYQGYCRGLMALEKNAIDRGFEPLMPDMWFVTHPTTSVPVILVRDEKFLPVAENISDLDPACVYFTVKELIGLLDTEVFEIKKRFDGFGNVIIDQGVIVLNRTEVSDD